MGRGYTREKSKHWAKRQLLVHVANGLCVSGDGRKLASKTKCSVCVMKSREASLISNYGITFTQYQEMVEASNNKCYICGWVWRVGKKHLAVDHNHKTGEVRGLLCWSCNRGLAMFRDNSISLVNAGMYLETDWKAKVYASGW